MEMEDKEPPSKPSYVLNISKRTASDDCVPLCRQPTTIQPFRFIVLRLPLDQGRIIKIIQVVPDTTINMGKFGSFLVNDILGHPFGLCYEVYDDKKLRLIDPADLSLQDEEQEEEVEIEIGNENGDLNGNEKPAADVVIKVVEANSNKYIYLDSKAQTLTTDEIEALKRDKKLSGQQIVEKVVQSHKEFDRKTIFSKAKYLRRKQKKFLRIIAPESAGCNQLIDYMRDKDPPRILELTQETVGYIMSLANVQPAGKYLVIDDTGGLIITAMLERMGGSGNILTVHENEHANLDLLKYSGITDNIREKIVKTMDWLQFLHPEEQDLDQLNDERELQPETLANMKSSRRGQYYKRRARAGELNEFRKWIGNQEFDGLIVASTLNLDSKVLSPLIECIGGSRPVVFYHPAKEILVNLMHLLDPDPRVLNPSLTETRVRPYQTLPHSTHPRMTMMAGGGYVVQGIRVFPGIVSAGGGRQRKRAKRSN